MTKEEREKRRDAEIDAIIDRYDMTAKCSLTRREIHDRIVKAMVSVNLAHVLADAANTLLMDSESLLSPMAVSFSRQDKYHYGQMLKSIEAAKRWAEKSVLEAYLTNEADLFAQDADWWYNIVRLIEDRTGDNVQKTQMVLNWLLTMPSELQMFKIRMADFKRALYDEEPQF